MNPNLMHDDAGSITGPAQWVQSPASLWLWPSAMAQKKKKDEVFLYSPHPTGIGEGRAIIDE